MDLIIRNGIVVTETDVQPLDVGIAGGRIAALGYRLDATGASEIDASGSFVLPGGVDSHTHIEEPFMGTTTSDDWYQGTSAAAAGGTTTVVDFAYQLPGGSLHDAVERWHRKAGANAIVDYAFHVVIVDPRPDVLAEIPVLVAEGYTSFKLFMCYDGLALDDLAILRILRVARECGGLPMIHAENDGLIRYLIEEALAAGESHPRWTARTRPPVAEVEATNRILQLAELIDVPIYIVHMSSGDAVDVLDRARDGGQIAIGETCPHYLALDGDEIEADGWEAARFTCAPPIRPHPNHERLWHHVSRGTLAAIGSDHDCFDLNGQKLLGRDRFDAIPLGIPGVETRLPVVLSEGARRRHLDLRTLVAALSTNPARLLGLYPRKGTIAISSDADLVVYDPRRETTITREALHQRVDFTPFEGWPVVGYPVLTVRRGQVVARDNEILAPRGSGACVTRGISSLFSS